MSDLMFLATPIIAGWLVFMGYLDPKYLPDETRWNHLLSETSPRRLRLEPKEDEWSELQQWALGRSVPAIDAIESLMAANAAKYSPSRGRDQKVAPKEEYASHA